MVEFLNHFCNDDTESGIHDSAVIHPEARIHKSVSIGPHCYIGKSQIDEGCRLHGNNFIHDNVTIGKNADIQAGAVIGAEGFGFVRGEDGRFVHMKHIAGVIIEDDVFIGTNASIIRGVLNNTIIRSGAKIDALVQIGHNVEIGENTFVISGTVVGGSATVGSDSNLSINSSISDKCNVGNNTTVGIGANIQKDVASGIVVMSSAEARSFPKSLFNK